jgi:hypothetical protein
MVCADGIFTADVKIHGGMRRLSILSFLALLIAIAANAQPSAADYEQVLVPITSTDIVGSNGSRWITDTWIANTSNEAADVLGPYLSPITSPPVAVPLHLPAGSSMTLPQPQSLAPQSGREGELLGVPRVLGRKIAFNSRVHDTSRQAQTLGTELPIVRENEFADSVMLLNVPGDSRYRLLLRIYTRTSDADVRVRADVLSALIPILDPPIAGPLFERVVHLDAPVASGAGAIASFGKPGYVQMAIPTFGVPMQIKVSSESGSANNIWAFLSITNNETQDVTLVTPR